MPSSEERETVDEQDYDDDYESAFCYDCGGRGWVVRCIDDLCHGQTECIHGDPPARCHWCNADGSKEDLWF